MLSDPRREHTPRQYPPATDAIRLATRLRLLGVNACDRHWSVRAVEQTATPAVEPGQLWFIELPGTKADLSVIEYRALTTANLVIYDRPLAKTLATILPLGGYAEPAASIDHSGRRQPACAGP